ncbi:unnamed protein product [Hermetia illucens]|uniref:C2H2-type domain-containing protein n=1 Tax=Hermetia illucens TaxID=343691 RepID=A0A7R8URU4_HERIL|nr:protein tiptop [Hermetia illucens]CAD7085866.1 unnamed protein product [Hermetia illucens]
MMLHEAVMLEIYRQALTASELASPRCQSRDSSSGGRCPSDDSNCSGNGSTTAPTPTSPVGITLPATLPPAAAAALLPPQSAAMAAYLNVAAAAAQQNRLLLGNPLAAAAGLVRAAQSPPSLPPLSASPPLPDDATPVLDFSTKRTRRDSDTDSKSDSDAVNLTKSSSDNSPLDLSVGSRKRNADEDAPPPSRKAPRPPDYKSVVSPWNTPIPPYFAAAVAAASLSPKNPLPVDWNGKKMAPNDATKALEKMSEMSRLGGPDADLGARPQNNHTNSGGGGRHSAWQSHWLNKGADSVKDVFKCVWCKQSFPTLASLTTHMKETQHCGVNVPPTGNITPTGASQQPHHPHHHHQSASAAASNSSSTNKSDLNLLIKETMPLPRKLVRGQDVWLGKGAEQTRQILKCMWCGQSFRSLAEMTSHMQQTQHYTNIISQEQIISWKQAEEGKGGPTGPGASGGAPSNSSSGANSTVSAVLTCKVCDQAFSSLKDLSNHMVKNAHYKEHIMRSITESGGRRRQTREKRKKSLPVRKLLELERAQHEFKNGEMKPVRDMASTRITCEKCGDKIETAMFVEHIRQCVGGSIPNSPRSMLKNSALSANSIIPPDSLSPLTPNSRDGRKSIGDESTSPASNRHISPHAPDIASPSPKEGGGGASTMSGGSNGSGGEKMSSPSVLNAIEQLIEKSFDTRSRHGNSSFSSNSHSSAPLGSSILKRLGIDESVDYTKPLIDPQTMNLLRTYQQQHYPKRERSGSESSSVSDRGSSRLESLTPERKPDLSNHGTPRQSPEKSVHHSENESEDNRGEGVKVKREPTEDDDSDIEGEEREKFQVKKEPGDEGNLLKDSESEMDLSAKRKSATPSSLAPSPSHMNLPNSTSAITSTPVPSPSSDRSITPRSSAASEKKIPSGSLTALTSMFDNLTGSNSTSSGASEPSSGGHSSGKKSSSHPLAALQQLCDKTETSTQNSRSSSSGALASSLPPTGGTASGAILAFSWACNDAVMTSDSIIKCAFCDTPFCSKGAYRHHLSKVHFVKDDVMGDSIASTNKSSNSGAASITPTLVGGTASNSGGGSSSLAPQKSNLPPNTNSSQSPKSSIAGGSGASGGNGSNSGNNSASGSGNSGSRSSPAGSVTSASSVGSVPVAGQVQSQSSASASASASSPFEESPHSKFLKYTELAKQLSSKYV